MSILDKKIQRLLAMKTDSPEMHNSMAALSTFYGTEGNTLEARRSLRVDLEQRSLTLAQDFVAQFADFQRGLETVESTIADMKENCAKMLGEIEATEEATAKFLQRTRDLNSVRDAEKKNVESMRNFVLKFKLSDLEIHTLLEAPLSRTTLGKFLETLSQLEDMKRHCSALLSMPTIESESHTDAVADKDEPPLEASSSTSENEHAPLEIYNAVSRYYERGFSRLFEWMSAECSRCFQEPRPIVDQQLVQAISVLEARPAFLHRVHDLILESRSRAAASLFVEALNSGGPNGVPPPLEAQSHNHVRFVNDILAWCHQQIAAEKELYNAVFHDGSRQQQTKVDGDRDFCHVFTGLGEAIVRRFHAVLRELTVNDIVSSFRLWKLFGFYAQMTQELLRLHVQPRVQGQPASESELVPAEVASQPTDPLTLALRDSTANAKSTFMVLARQRADRMLETIASAPSNLHVSPVVESSLRDLSEILKHQSSSLTTASSTSNNAITNEGELRDVNAVLDLFLHPMLQTSLRSAKVGYIHAVIPFLCAALHLRPAALVVSRCHSHSVVHGEQRTCYGSGFGAIRLCCALDGGLCVVLLFARDRSRGLTRFTTQAKVTQERSSWRELLVVELSGSVVDQCGLTQFLEQCKTAVEPRSNGDACANCAV